MNPPARMISAPLRLTAMTIRGLGPYLHGARLEFKPLTILCGENGSGKSTWIETLRAFKSISSDKRFPLKHLKYPSSGGDRYGLNQTLAVSQLGLQTAGETQQRLQSMTRTGDQEQFGPPGCLGLEIEARSDFTLPGLKVLDRDPSSDAKTLLLGARVKAGARLSLRWALPTAQDGFEDLVELRINSDCIRLRRNRNNTEESKLFTKQAKEPFMTLECTAGFLGIESSTDGKFIELGQVDWQPQLSEEDIREWKIVDIIPVVSNVIPSIDAFGVEKFLDRFLKLFRGVVRAALRGFFPIGPIRKLLTEISADSTPPISKLDGDLTSPAEGPSDFQLRSIQVYEEAIKRIRPDRRYVGHDGGRTQFLHAFWAYNLMRQPEVPFEGGISSEFELYDFKRDFKSPPNVADSFNNIPIQFQEHILGIVDSAVRDEWIQGRDSNERDNIAIRLLNSALKSRNLFAPREFRPDISSDAFLEVRMMFGATREEQDDCLASRQRLSDGEVVRINRLLLEAVIDKSDDDWVEEEFKQGLQVKSNDYPWRRCSHRSGFVLETFVSYWMRELTGARIKYQKFEGESLDANWSPDSPVIPNGGLVSEDRQWHKRGDWADRTDGREHSHDGRSYDLSGTIQHPVLAFDSDWSLMSTGFHQLSPIVVQSALLHQNEIMSVENPEAHLHPSLQLKVAQFLMFQALAGKIILVETHSDLFVRRILRAIREEQLLPGHVFHQSAIGIYFTRLSEESTYASIEKLEVNEQGQVHNWPPGFMDDDLKEADRWLNSNMHSGFDHGDADE